MTGKINTKIKKMIDGSLLLDEKQKDAIRKKLKTANLKKKTSLIKILESEKKGLDSIIEGYLEKNGKDGLNDLKRFIAKTKNTISQKKEGIDKRSEKEVMAKLLDNLA